MDIIYIQNEPYGCEVTTKVGRQLCSKHIIREAPTDSKFETNTQKPEEIFAGIFSCVSFGLHLAYYLLKRGYRRDN